MKQLSDLSQQKGDEGGGAVVWVVTLGFNNAQDTIECLTSLSASQGVQIQLLFTDNNSSDDSVARVLAEIPAAHVIQTGANLGFARGFNVGLDYCLQQGADYVFMINNDTVVAPDCIARLLEEAQAQPQAASFTVEKLYVKDLSFEAPNAPQVFNEQGQPDLQMKLSQKVNRLAEAAFEVSLGITLTCTLNGKTAYLAEVEQAGVFGLAGFDEQILDAMLGTQCPNILYPYATAAIGNLITAGGFPPFPMQPINFDALYGESLRQRAEQIAQQGGDAGLANAETAGNA